MSETRKVIKLVYVGRRYGKRLLYCYVPADNLNAPMKGWRDFHPYQCTPGVEFEVEANGENDGSIFPATAKNFKQADAEDELVAQWQIEDKAAYAESQTEALVKRLAKENRLDDILTPVKNLYRKLTSSQKDVFILTLIKELKCDEITDRLVAVRTEAASQARQHKKHAGRLVQENAKLRAKQG